MTIGAINIVGLVRGLSASGPLRARSGRPRRHEPTRQGANEPKTLERSYSEREAIRNLKLTSPPSRSTRGSDRYRRAAARPHRLAAVAAPSATRICRAAGPRLKQHGGQRAGDSDHGDSVFGRSTGLTQAINKTNSGDGGQPRQGAAPTNMKGRSAAGMKRQDATSVEVY